MLEQPTLPEHDPHDVVESAVVARLAKNWSQRATVKKPEPQLDDLFDTTKRDFPDALIPFGEHDTFLGAEPEQPRGLRSQQVRLGY